MQNAKEMEEVEKTIVKKEDALQMIKEKEKMCMPRYIKKEAQSIKNLKLIE